MSVLLWCVAVRVDAHASQRAAENFPASSPRNVTTARGQADVIGRITIPKLRLSAPITNDIDKIELLRGVGHIPGTAFAGGLGTMGLAGHRDTFFRALRNVKPGMEIMVSSESGEYRYTVEALTVVDPSDVSVLMIQTKPKLVLVTCYPFTFIGAAPRRFIVTATLTSVLANGN